jgi:hypothetical protein
METCLQNTMCCREHLIFLQNIIDYINDNDILGSIVECGVWKGGCSMYMMICQKKYGMNRDFYLYDTFDGMTFPNKDKDEEEAFDVYNSVNNSTYKRDYDKWHNENKWAFAPIEMVKNNINLTKYDETKITYVKGDVCETLNKTVPSEISILRLDTDFYDSTKKELDVLFPKVTKNGFIIIDDYYSWQGSRLATDEFINENKDKILFIDTCDIDTCEGGPLVFRKK